MFKYNEIVGNILDYENDGAIALYVDKEGNGFDKDSYWLEKRYKNEFLPVKLKQGDIVGSTNGKIFKMCISTDEDVEKCLKKLYIASKWMKMKKIILPRLYPDMNTIFTNIFGSEENLDIKCIYSIENRELNIQDPDIEKINFKKGKGIEGETKYKYY
jgi:hypothetical protein